MSVAVNSLSIKALKAGDKFESVQRNNIAPTSGTIAKIGRVSVRADSLYMGHAVNFALPITNLIGGVVVRDGRAFNVTE